ncbi:TonB-dependent receptor domain-containing protein [Cupriavidus basilensis]
MLIHGLSFSGNVTYVDSRILSNDSYVPTIPGATSVGKRVPYVPTWRSTLAVTYQPDSKWAYTLAARYSSRVYATVDNTDINPATYQGFESFFVMDARVRYQFDKHAGAARWAWTTSTTASISWFHPFPQRTFYLTVKYAL